MVPRYATIDQTKQLSKKDAAELEYPPVCHPLMIKTRQESQQQPANQKARREVWTLPNPYKQMPTDAPC